MSISNAIFIPQPFMAVRVIVLYLVGTLVRGCRCAMSWCDLDLTFDLAVVTLTYKILSGLYLGNRKVEEVDTG